MIVHVNGAFVPEENAFVSIHDRGFLYGDTVYEAVRTRNGTILFWEDHLRRLRRSCELAAFEVDWTGVDLDGIVGELLRRNGLEDARIRITVSRGAGGPDQVEGFVPTWVVVPAPFRPVPEETYERGVAAVLVGRVRNSARALDPEMKSGNFLGNLLARREALLRGAVEGIMTNLDGMVAEGSMANLFWVRAGVLETPALEAGILHGVTRAKVLAIARAAVAAGGDPIPGLSGVDEVLAPPSRIAGAEELFLTSTSLEVLPVTKWEDAPVGGGRRGPVARELRARLQALYPAG